MNRTTQMTFCDTLFFFLLISLVDRLQGNIYARNCVIDDNRLPQMSAGDYMARIMHFTKIDKIEHFMLETISYLTVKMRSYTLNWFRCGRLAWIGLSFEQFDICYLSYKKGWETARKCAKVFESARNCTKVHKTARHIGYLCISTTSGMNHGGLSMDNVLK